MAADTSHGQGSTFLCRSPETLAHAELIVFCRRPAPGQTKTRLARVAGDQAAVWLYRAFVMDLFETAARVRAASVRVLYVAESSPGAACNDRVAAALNELQEEAGTSFPVEPQIRGDLGDRMAGALSDSFIRGNRAAVIIGTDSPHLEAGYIRGALEALTGGVPPLSSGGARPREARTRAPLTAAERPQRHAGGVPPLSSGGARPREGRTRAPLTAAERPQIHAGGAPQVVLGPSADGGYVLVGARPPLPEPLFADIPWSTVRVLRRTVEALKANGISFQLVAPSFDVDTVDDLPRLREAIRQLRERGQPFPRRTAEALAALNGG